MRGPGISNDISFNLFRNFRLTESARLRIGGEFFNVFNHANFSAVGTVFGSATFGILTASFSNRATCSSAPS